MRPVLAIILICTSLLAAQQGSVTVHNSTSSELYIVVSGRNQGMLASHSYQCYSAPYGDVPVEAYKGYTTADPYCKKWARLSGRYPYGEVDFTDYDF